jgi:hypothetical protein
MERKHAAIPGELLPVLPCPFCLFEPSSIIYEGSHPSVLCTQCGAQGPQLSPHYHTEIWQAVAAWNNRLPIRETRNADS